MKSSELPVPSESAEQQRLFQWARMAQGRYPELRWLYHVPNEGKRTRTTGARLAAEGLIFCWGVFVFCLRRAAFCQ